LKNIILQHWSEELGSLELASKNNIEKYANFCNSEYRLLLGNVFRKNLSSQCQKLYMLDEAFDDYDIVVMLDMDMFWVKGNTENIFTDAQGIGLYQDYQKIIFEKFCNHKKYKKLANPNGPYWGGAIWRLDKKTRMSLRKHVNENEMKIFNGNYNDEGIMHRLASLAKISHDILPDKWCWGNCFPGYENAAMIHIRHKFNHEGPKVPKWDVYKQLVSEGIIE
jgi:hypothetical protein